MMRMIQLMQVMQMRTTVDLPEAKHHQLKVIAQKRAVSLGQLITELTDIALQQSANAPTIGSTLATSAQTGLLTLSVGRPISSAEVAALLESP